MSKEEIADEIAPTADPYGILDAHDEFVKSLRGEEAVVTNANNEPLSLVKLTWIDSAGRDGVVWHFKDEVSDIRATICRSVGYLIS